MLKVKPVDAKEPAGAPPPDVGAPGADDPLSDTATAPGAEAVMALRRELNCACGAE